MKLIVGLGNPGEIYINSRHNIGFLVVEALSKRYKIPLKKNRVIFSLSGKGEIEDTGVILALPFTFMNLSGNAVAKLVKRHKMDLDKLLVVCDDLNLDFGHIKIRARGSSGGHQGLKSIIDALGSQDFPRLRIGIGRPYQENSADISSYVLAHFTGKEKDRLKGIINAACDAARVWVTRGITECMNIFNRRSR